MRSFFRENKGFLFYWFMIVMILTSGIIGMIHPSRLSGACGWLAALGWFVNSDKWQKLAMENLKQLKALVKALKGGEDLQ